MAAVEHVSTHWRYRLADLASCWWMGVHCLPTFIVLGLSYSDGLSWQRQWQVSSRINDGVRQCIRSHLCTGMCWCLWSWGQGMCVHACVCVWHVIYSHTSQITGQRQLPGHLTLGHPGGTPWSGWALKTHTHKDTHTHPDETNFGREQRMLTVTIETCHKGRGREGETEEEAGS